MRKEASVPADVNVDAPLGPRTGGHGGGRGRRGAPLALKGAVGCDAILGAEGGSPTGGVLREV